jgi:hypothetical protein
MRHRRGRRPRCRRRWTWSHDRDRLQPGRLGRFGRCGRRRHRQELPGDRRAPTSPCRSTPAIGRSSAQRGRGRRCSTACPGADPDRRGCSTTTTCTDGPYRRSAWPARTFQRIEPSRPQRRSPAGRGPGPAPAGPCCATTGRSRPTAAERAARRRPRAAGPARCRAPGRGPEPGRTSGRLAGRALPAPAAVPRRAVVGPDGETDDMATVLEAARAPGHRHHVRARCRTRRTPASRTYVPTRVAYRRGPDRRGDGQPTGPSAYLGA